MNTETILELVKARIGIRTDVRNSYLEAIIKGIVQELKDDQGLVLTETNPHHLMFMVDYAVWRYQSVASTETTSTSIPLSMPRHLQWRLHNLMISGVKNADV
jgi:hypothetical protein